MGKSIANKQGKGGKKEQEYGLNLSLEQESSQMESLLGGMSGRGSKSSADGLFQAILKEESIPSTSHYYCPAPAPGSVAATVAGVEEQQTGQPPSTQKRKRCGKVTKTIKKAPSVRHKTRPNQQNTNTSQGNPTRKINHRKYTVKKCSNFIRKTLKMNGFKEFTKLEGGFKGAQGYRNRRGSTIYLPVGLLILDSILKKQSFKKFTTEYLNDLRQLKEVEQRKFRANRNQKSHNYIIQFKRAKQSVELFCEGKEQECILKFFGATENSYKEKTYLEDSIEFYNQWKAELIKKEQNHEMNNQSSFSGMTFQSDETIASAAMIPEMTVNTDYDEEISKYFNW